MVLLLIRRFLKTIRSTVSSSELSEGVLCGGEMGMGISESLGIVRRFGEETLGWLDCDGGNEVSIVSTVGMRLNSDGGAFTRRASMIE